MDLISAIRANKQLTKRFERYLKAHPDVLKKVSKRVSTRIRRQACLGYAPKSYDLQDWAKQRNIRQSTLAALGLVTENGNSFFRNRIIIPIFYAGWVIGFGGRAVDESDIKYLNSKKSDLFDKKSVLFNLQNARESIIRTKAAVIVEGYFDCLKMHEIGITNCVATCGTSFTAEHASMLQRYTNKVLIATDGDGAGRKAAKKIARSLANLGIPSAKLRLPGLDPEEFVNEYGSTKMRKLIKATWRRDGNYR